jgi:cyclopropane fatty-acyl-phospholipid synthase-like methyltransferase
MASGRETRKRAYTPALRFHALTGYFDALMARSVKESKFRQLLLDQLEPEPGHRVLDLGCGTGTLAILLKTRVPEVEVVALDPDPEALRIARGKADAAGVKIEFHQALAWDAHLPANSFDRVVSSLVFHHLRFEEKRRTLAAAREWLRPHGELHVADWGKAQNVLMRIAFLGVQILDGFETTAENVRVGLVPAMESTGFEMVEETRRDATLLGTLSLYRARRRGSPD